jgi:hypothetical protein
VLAPSGRDHVSDGCPIRSVAVPLGGPAHLRPSAHSWSRYVVCGSADFTRVTTPVSASRSRLRNRFRCERSVGSIVRTPALARRRSSAVCSSALQRFLWFCLACPATGRLLRGRVLSSSLAERRSRLHAEVTDTSSVRFHPRAETGGHLGGRRAGLACFSLVGSRLSLTHRICRRSKAYLQHGR